MKWARSVFFISLVFFSFLLNGQYYYVPHINAGTNPGGLNNDDEYPFGNGLPGGWNVLFTGASSLGANPQYTPAQALPFTFEFNGDTVSTYKVSTNGFLTFDTSAILNPDSNNFNLPSSLLPDKSVVIWGLFNGGFGSSISSDYICTKTFGLAPNRQHWVHFNSYSAINVGWTYWSIVLEESTNKIFIVDQRSNLTTLNLSLSLGIQIDSSSAYSVFGNPSVTSYSTNDPTPTDNSFHEFIPGNRPRNNAEALTVRIDSIEIGTSSIPIQLLLKNLGADTLKKIQIAWTADSGQTIHLDTLYPNLATFDTSTIQHSIPWSSGIVGNPYELKVWISNPNDSVDHDQLNDTAIANTFLTNGLTVARNPLMEMLTIAVCPPCTDTRVSMDTTMHYLPNVIPVEVHSCFGFDSLVNSHSTAICAQLGINTVPMALVDRHKFSDEPDLPIHRYGNNWLNRAIQRNQVRSPMDINISGSFQVSNRSVSLNADFNFVDYPYPGDIRVGFMIIEDSVSGPNHYYYNQQNYFNSQFGHPFYGMGSTIIGYNHRFVLRDILPATWGDSTVIPPNINLNSNYTLNQ